MNVEFLMAARARLLYGGQTSLAAALIARADKDTLAKTLEEAFKRKYGGTGQPSINVVELMIAERIDNGEPLPISNQEGFGAAKWLSTGTLANLPDPIPRAFVLYLAKAFAEAGKFPTMTAALKDILANRTFV